MIPQHGTLEISRSRLLHNIALLRQKISPNSQICATIKADAYGHGTGPMIQLLKEAAIKWVCVYSSEEAFLVSLLESSFNILVLAPLILKHRDDVPLQSIRNSQIRFNITDIDSALRLDALADMARSKITVHIQIDVGLTRMGVDALNSSELINAVLSLKHLKLEGLFAHLSHGDVPNHHTLHEQQQLLWKIAAPFKQKLPDLLIHLQNSGGTFNIETNPTEQLDLIRAGIALYGLQPSLSHPIPNLLPIAQVTAPILAIHDRPPNTGVGYGHTFITSRQSKLAILPVGYADGYPRLLSNKSIAQLHNTDLPIVGRVSMDQIILDITDLPSAKIGDTVTVISNNPDKPNSLDQMAHSIGTIGYELATHLSAGGNRLNRIIID